MYPAIEEVPEISFFPVTIGTSLTVKIPIVTGPDENLLMLGWKKERDSERRKEY